MSKQEERTEIEKMRRQLLLLDEPYITQNFERIGALEARFEALLDMPPMVVKLGDLRDRIEALEKRLGAAVTDQLTEIEMGRDARFEALEDAWDTLSRKVDALYSRVSEEVARQAIEQGTLIANQFAAARRGEMRELTYRIAALEAWLQESDEEPDNHANDEYQDPGPDSISPLG